MVDFERGNDFRCATLARKTSKNPSRMYQSYKVILGILHVWEEAGVVVSISMVLHTCAKKRRCDPYLGTKFEEAQLHCYLESCACVAAATTTVAQFASTTIICDLCLPTFPAAFMHQA